ncbi:MAG: hypothetical protein PHI59_10425, partial [Candidatus Omnitrophica bacterium]|nr:hypothetical protein [Candidatus Omnitrophota bacterium]
MAIKRYLQGIAIVALLMIGAILIVMAAPQSITFVSPPTPDNGTINSNFINISVTLGSPGSAKLNWNGIFEPMDGSGTQFYKNKSVTNQIYTFYVNASDINGTNWTTSSTRTVTVSMPTSPFPPGLSSPNPSSSPVNSIFGFSQNFNITVNQTANVSWKIGSLEVQNLSVSAGAKSEYISNATQAIGNNYIVTATAYNANGTSASPATWTWNVLPSQGPPPVLDVTYTRGATWINWTWTNPTTGNFNYTIVKINDTLQPNQTNNYYNFTQFSPGTTNTIKLQTVDNTGNINSTIISKPATTFNTVVGTNVNVTLNNVKVVFSQTVSEGDTSVIVSSTNSLGGGPHTFQDAGSYYNISTNATSSGNITVEIPYTPAGINESLVKLYHWNS